jgi:hypothetical protein
MLRYLPELDAEGYDQTKTGYYDSQDPEQAEIHAQAVVDVTDRIPGVNVQVVLKYARDTRRHFVLLCDRPHANVDLGMSTMCPLDSPATEGIMQFVADSWKIGLEQLVEVVEEFRPEDAQPLPGLN